MIDIIIDRLEGDAQHLAYEGTQPCNAEALAVGNARDANIDYKVLYRADFDSWQTASDHLGFDWQEEENIPKFDYSRRFKRKPVRVVALKDPLLVPFYLEQGFIPVSTR